MRGIPGSFIFIFFVVVFAVEFFAFLAIRELTDQRATRKKINYLYWGISLVLSGILLYAFVNPNKIREVPNYHFFYFVISISFFNLVPKALLAIFYLFSRILKLLKAHFLARLVLLSSMILSLGLMLIIGYGIVFGRKSLRVIQQEIILPTLPKSIDNLTIVQLSDLHLGSFEDNHFMKRCARKIDEINPDLLVFTGDMVNNFAQEMDGFEDILSSMHAKHGKFAILGNHDYGDYSNWPSRAAKEQNHHLLEKQIEQAGFQLLLNQSVTVPVRDTTIEIIGVQNWGHHPFPQYANLNKAMQGINPKLFEILLTHDPAHWEVKVVPNTQIPLTLAGHTHAAQSGVQFAGIEFSPMYFVQKCWGGLYKRGNQYLYVNRGIGCIGLLGRIEMNPEITVLKLRSE
ncbi:MAG TPA: metallophosphoesterase [Sunxiuqinia sp.]|nr:metallophosphoesterase [Sunxiuqinia sp.]